jgi:L-ascorbate metabolism protein UlaG (beta-lactamase superfamily)
MEVTFLGHSSFKIKTKSASVVTDPFDPSFVGIKYPKIDGDIVTVSHDHKDHNQSDLVVGAKKVILTPGEYEISGISIIGISTFHDAQNGGERGKNTIYVFEAEGLRLAHLGDLGHAISDEVVDLMGTIDVLMIPVGGFYTIGSKEAAEVAAKIDPYFIIPMHYKVAGLNEENFSKLEPVDNFLKEVGMQVENLPKFSIKKEDIIEDQNTKVIVLHGR